MIEKKDVDYVAGLASIEVTEEQRRSLAIHLSKIIDYIDKLKKVDIENVEPMRGLHIKGNVFREDKTESFSLKESILDNFPSREGDYLKISKVIE